MISVLIPCYNEKNTIEEIVNRINNLENLSLEIIIIDDNSNDGTKKILLENIIHYLIEPFKNGYLWKLSVLDLNYIFILVLSLIIYHNINLMNLYHSLNTHHHHDS